MKRSSIAVLALVLVGAAAQRPGGGTSRGSLRSGPPTLTNPNSSSYRNWGYGPRLRTPFIEPWTGAHRWMQPRSFPNPLILNWTGWSPFDPFWFYNAPDPGYPIGPYWPDNYSEPSNIPVQPPPAVEPQVPMGGETAPQAEESSNADTSGMPVYRGPGSPPDISDEHPLLIALKNRWAYTVLKYWVKGNTFHFITTQGDHMQVPANMLDRVYPAPNRAPKTDPKADLTH